MYYDVLHDRLIYIDFGLLRANFVLPLVFVVLVVVVIVFECLFFLRYFAKSQSIFRDSHTKDDGHDRERVLGESEERYILAGYPCCNCRVDFFKLNGVWEFSPYFKSI